MRGFFESDIYLRGRGRLTSIVDTKNPGKSLDVEVKPTAYEIIEAITKLEKELSGIPDPGPGCPTCGGFYCDCVE